MAVKNVQDPMCVYDDEKRRAVGTGDVVRGASGNGNFRRLSGRVHTLSECFSVFVGMGGMGGGKAYRHRRKARARRYGNHDVHNALSARHPGRVQGTGTYRSDAGYTP